MAKNRIDSKRSKMVSDRLSLPQAEVERAVGSFFGCIVSYARSLPFRSRTKIYRKQAFMDYVKAFNIPMIGRIGPVYSRYLLWRANEASGIVQKSRNDFRYRLSSDEKDRLFSALLAGDIIEMPEKKKNSELFNRIWLVDKNGKRSARQVIPK